MNFKSHPYRPCFDPAEQPESIEFDLIWFLPALAAFVILGCALVMLLR